MSETPTQGDPLETQLLSRWEPHLGPNSRPEHTLGCAETRLEAPPPGSTPDATRERVVQTTQALEVEGLLGRGGMGVVYSARDEGLQRDVAVKILASSKTISAADEERFLAEARISARLQHPGVVPVYALGRDSRGAPLLAMQRVEGQTWMALIQEDPPSDPAALLRHMKILQRVLEACSYAHDVGLIHRDLKPENVMVGTFGQVFVLDWGLAVPASEATETASAAGTPAYMAPEMANCAKLSRATDVYLLGAILYELLVGRPPHAQPSALHALLSAAQNDVVPFQARVDPPPGLIELTETCLRTDPEQRYPSALELSQALEHVFSGEEQRLESERLTAAAAAGLAESDTFEEDDPYTRLFELEAQAQQALQLWPQNQVAAELQTQIASTLAHRACALQDLALASSMARRVGTLGAPDPDLEGEIERLRRELDPVALGVFQRARSLLFLVSGLELIVTVVALIGFVTPLATRSLTSYADRFRELPSAQVLLCALLALLVVLTLQLLHARALAPGERPRYVRLQLLTLLATALGAVIALTIANTTVLAAGSAKLWALATAPLPLFELLVLGGLQRPEIGRLFPKDGESPD